MRLQSVHLASVFQLFDSVAHVKSLLVMLLERLELKGKKFLSFAPSSEDDINSMWSKLLIVDSALQKDESLTKKNPFLTRSDGVFKALLYTSPLSV